ncbi:MAG: discoidin domain-containing protein [Clostridia bacterium]|nr:discoidin domain-containing protein [Clostridia bacterium]
MKKLSLMLAFVLVFACVLVACNDETETSSTPEAESSVAATESSEAAKEESSEAAIEESSEAEVEESSEAEVEESSEPEEVSEPDEDDGENVEPGEAIKVEGTNVALNAKCTVSGTGVGHGNYTASLTDGQANNAMAYDNTWFAFYCNGADPTVLNAPDKQGYVIIDLGAEKDINAIRINFANNTGAGVCSAEKVTVSFSNDGESFEKAGRMPLYLATAEDTTNDNKVYWSELEVEGTARYVKVDITLIGTFVFLNEIEVYA